MTAKHSDPIDTSPWSSFTVRHGSVTEDKAIKAAANVEAHLGMLLNGDKKAFNKINVEDLVVLIQFARNTASKASAPELLDALKQIAKEHPDTAASEIAIRAICSIRPIV